MSGNKLNPLILNLTLNAFLSLILYVLVCWRGLDTVWNVGHLIRSFIEAILQNLYRPNYLYNTVVFIHMYLTEEVMALSSANCSANFVSYCKKPMENFKFIINLGKLTNFFVITSSLVSQKRALLFCRTRFSVRTH